MGKDQFFLLMTNDHRSTKNKLEEQVRKRVRDTFNKALITDIKEVCRHLDSIIESENANHKRCKPLEGVFWERLRLDGYSNDTYYVHGLFNLVFYQVKEVNRG